MELMMLDRRSRCNRKVPAQSLSEKGTGPLNGYRKSSFLGTDSRVLSPFRTDSGQADDRMIAQRDLFGHEVTYRDEQAFVAVDAEFDFEARLPLFGGRLGVQEGRVLLVDPEVIAAILFIRRDKGHA